MDVSSKQVCIGSDAAHFWQGYWFTDQRRCNVCKCCCCLLSWTHPQPMDYNRRSPLLALLHLSQLGLGHHNVAVIIRESRSQKVPTHYGHVHTLPCLTLSGVLKDTCLLAPFSSNSRLRIETHAWVGIWYMMFHVHVIVSCWKAWETPQIPWKSKKHFFFWASYCPYMKCASPKQINHSV